MTVDEYEAQEADMARRAERAAQAEQRTHLEDIAASLRMVDAAANAGRR